MEELGMKEQNQKEKAEEERNSGREMREQKMEKNK